VCRPPGGPGRSVVAASALLGGVLLSSSCWAEVNSPARFPQEHIKMWIFLIFFFKTVWWKGGGFNLAEFGMPATLTKAALKWQGDDHGARRPVVVAAGLDALPKSDAALAPDGSGVRIFPHPARSKKGAGQTWWQPMFPRLDPTPPRPRFNTRSDYLFAPSCNGPASESYSYELSSQMFWFFCRL
jgi:hypothetical protein